MFEARLSQASLLKKIVESVRELVTDANLDCSESGISMQAMDSSHVSLCTLMIREDGFQHFRCDRSLSLGLSLTNISKILKGAANEDTVTLKAEDTADSPTADSLTIMFESQNQERISDFELKLMDIDSELLNIPKTEYCCIIQMPSGQFAHIVRDLAVIGDTCTIACDKDGVKFSVSGDLGTGNIMVRSNNSVDKEEDKVTVTMEEPVKLKFALRYLALFTKATPLGPIVTISLTPENPVMVEYPIGTFGYVRYYLAPKIDDNEE